MRAALRLAAASTAASGLLLHLLSLAFLAWAAGTGHAALLGMEPSGVASRALLELAWGVGFSLLALVMVVRVGERHEVLVAALFLGLYSLWGGVLFPTAFAGASWRPGASIVLDALTHAVGIRFTQLFPRPLEREDLSVLGPGPVRRWWTRVAGALLDPRIYWPVALAFEASFRVLPVPDLLAASHLVVWLFLGTTYMYASYRKGSAEDRRRIFWILEGVAVFFVAEVLFLALWSLRATGMVELELSVWVPWLRAVSAWATLVCFALAIFHAGAFDSGLVLRRTTVAGIAGGIVVVLFVGLETLLEEVLADALGLRSRVGGIVSGLVAALTFHPLTKQIDRAFERLSTRDEAGEGASDASAAEAAEAG